MPSSPYSNYAHAEPRWQYYRRAPAAGIPATLREWLFDEGSLTQRLIQASGNQFQVDIICQHIARPRRSEAQVLNMPPRELALVREVLLRGRGEPWVYARSILPVTTLQGPLRRLRKLDSRPLGALLFKDPSMVRGPMQVANIHPVCHALPEAVKQCCQIHHSLWGRRSVFYLSEKPLLVSEIFLPAFTPYNQAINHRLQNHTP